MKPCLHDCVSSTSPSLVCCSGSLDVCRQCVECGAKHGQCKRNRDIVTWLKKKRRLIRREELLAFLLDKPYPPDSTHLHLDSERQDGLMGPHHFSHSSPLHHVSSHPPRPLLTSSCISGLNFPPSVSVSLPVSTSTPCFAGAPRGRWALLGREEQGVQSGEGEVYSVRENSRKRLSSSSASGAFEFAQESPPLSKRMKI